MQEEKRKDGDRQQGRIVWADQLRGICMLLILWLHTDMYYTGVDTIPYGLYVCNALTIFFFISGYFCYRQEPFSLRHKLTSIVRGLLVPYLLFTSVLAIPKAMVRHLPLHDVIVSILTGSASWFVAALMVAEVLFACCLYLRRDWAVHLLALVALMLSWLLSNDFIGIGADGWIIHAALLGLVFLYLGYQYHRHESRLASLQRPLPVFVLLLSGILLKAYILTTGTQMVVGPVVISNYPVFLLDSVTFILLALSLTKLLPPLSWLQWIGRHSLYYYFFCGAVPTFVTMMLPPYQGLYVTVLLPYCIVCLLTTGIAFGISYCKRRLQ
ncbi:MAG: acyltransferase [Prevotella sp.]|nr:acyltransferase [Prevotella sp.]